MLTPNFQDSGKTITVIRTEIDDWWMQRFPGYVKGQKVTGMITQSGFQFVQPNGSLATGSWRKFEEAFTMKRERVKRMVADGVI